MKKTESKKTRNEKIEDQKIIGKTAEEKEEIMDRLFDMVRVPKRADKLDEEGLLRLGFTEHDDPIMKRKVYRIKPSMYYYPQIQMSLNTKVPSTNPNCGILSIYHPEINDMTFGKEGNKTVPVHFAERVTPIAWYVDTYTRLHKIINALIHQNI